MITFSNRNEVLRDPSAWATQFFESRGFKPLEQIAPYAEIGPQFIISHVALAFGIRNEDLLTTRRDQVFVHPRHVAMYLAADLTRQSFPRLALVFKKQDHTTIMYARNKIAALMQASPEKAEQIKALRQLIIDSWDAAKALPIAAS